MTKPKLASYANENDGDGRYYTHPLTKERLPSVTSILKLVNKEALIQWAVNNTVDWAVENLDMLYQRSVEQGKNIAKYRWKDVRDDRAQVGTGVHETVEAEHTGSWDYPELNDEQKLMMNQWRLLNEEHEIKPILSEFTLWNTGISAGTADGYWIIDGERCLVDLKTSNNTWPEHHYQLAALWKSPVYMNEFEPDKWEEIKAPEYDRVAIVHLKKDLREIIYIDDLENKYDAFKGYVDVWNAQDRIKKNEKAHLQGGF